MNSVFVSYSGSRVDRALLFNALRDHGMSPWRDVDSLNVGDATTDTIEAELARCSTALLWINRDIVDSDYVALVELPAIARANQRGLRIVPVFDGLTPSEAADLISVRGLEIGDNNGHVVDPTADPETTATEIAARLVRAHVTHARTADAKPVVRLVSYDDTADLRDEAILNLDWRHRIIDGRLDAANEQRLRSALTTATTAFKQAFGAADIDIAVKAHLPLAVALGHSFAEPTGCQLRLRRGHDEYMTTRDSLDDVTPLTVGDAPKGPITTRAACVEASVSRNIEAGVNNYIGHGTRYRHRTVLEPPSGASRDAVSRPAAAAAWARQIATTVITVSDRVDVNRVDLFLATPVELAVTVGWWLNASGPVNVMNWTGKAGPYERMWLLP